MSKEEAKPPLPLPSYLPKEFKMAGTIGDSKGAMGYMSFLRQVEAGLRNKVAERDIVDATIKAVAAGTHLRGYLEGCENLDLGKLRALIRAFYKEKSAPELYHELCTLKQSDKEEPLDFIFRALELKHKLIFIAKEAKGPIKYEAALIDQTFRNSLITGIRDETLRFECQTIIHGHVHEEELVEGVNEFVRISDERRLKQSKAAKVSTVESETSPHFKELLEELKNLRADVNELKGRREGPASTSQTNRHKCEECLKTNTAKCRHCYTCGSSNHFKSKCPKNVKGVPQKGGR